MSQVDVVTGSLFESLYILASDGLLVAGGTNIISGVVMSAVFRTMVGTNPL